MRILGKEDLMVSSAMGLVSFEIELYCPKLILDDLSFTYC